MTEQAPPEGYRALDRIGGFIALAGPYFYRERADGDAPDVFHYGFRSADGHKNTNGVVHGGALLTFADTAMGATVYYLAKRPCATISLNSEFVSAAKPGSWIDATVTITRQTRSLTFVRGTLSAGKETLLTASGIWKLFAPNLPGHDQPSV